MKAVAPEPIYVIVRPIEQTSLLPAHSKEAGTAPTIPAGFAWFSADSDAEEPVPDTERMTESEAPADREARSPAR